MFDHNYKPRTEEFLHPWQEAKASRRTRGIRSRPKNIAVACWLPGTCSTASYGTKLVLTVFFELINAPTKDLALSRRTTYSATQLFLASRVAPLLAQKRLDQRQLCTIPLHRLLYLVSWGLLKPTSTYIYTTLYLSSQDIPPVQLQLALVSLALVAIYLIVRRRSPSKEDPQGSDGLLEGDTVAQLQARGNTG